MENGRGWFFIPTARKKNHPLPFSIGEDEPHTVTQDGDYVFTDGKWKGMVFHPYRQEEVYELIPDGMTYEISEGYDSMTILLKKVTP